MVSGRGGDVPCVEIIQQHCVGRKGLLTIVMLFRCLYWVQLHLLLNAAVVSLIVCAPLDLPCRAFCLRTGWNILRMLGYTTCICTPQTRSQARGPRAEINSHVHLLLHHGFFNDYMYLHESRS